MKKLPKSDNSLLLRTDFSDDAAWAALCEAVQVPSEEGFQANLDCISDPAYDGLTLEQLVAGPEGRRSRHIFAFVADRIALTEPEQPVLVVDLYDEPGRTFRVIPREMWGVENNLSIANMNYSEFADNADPDGVFRGFPQAERLSRSLFMNRSFTPSFQHFQKDVERLSEKRGEMREERTRADGLSRLSSGISPDVSHLYRKGSIRTLGSGISEMELGMEL